MALIPAKLLIFLIKLNGTITKHDKHISDALRLHVSCNEREKKRVRNLNYPGKSTLLKFYSTQSGLSYLRFVHLRDYS